MPPAPTRAAPAARLPAGCRREGGGRGGARGCGAGARGCGAGAGAAAAGVGAGAGARGCGAGARDAAPGGTPARVRGMRRRGHASAGARGARRLVSGPGTVWGTCGGGGRGGVLWGREARGGWGVRPRAGRGGLVSG
ncbi:hypothetical protein DN402_27075 [Streptomyces sp. SW4]|nr:hypothetical protein DN402_27075 [Streptomyces sp. SW4]